MDSIVASVIDRAMAATRSRGIAVYTFALYFDHESPAVSACIDTAESSGRTVRGINAYNRKYFLQAVESADLKAASLWSSNVGRSLSLGDFALVNVARTDLAEDAESKGIFVAMLRGLVAKEQQIATLASDRGSLLLCCSGPNDEAEYVWAVPDEAA